jgi:hypothetical protein
MRVKKFLIFYLQSNSKIYSLNTFIFFLFLIPFFISSQSWELEEIHQLIRPRFHTLSKVFVPFSPLPHAYYNVLETGATFPLAKKIKADIQNDALKNIFQKKWDKVLSIRAYALFGSLKGGIRNHYLQGDTVLKIRNYYLQGTLGGIHLTKKFRILFWQVQSEIAGESGYNDFPGFYNALMGLFHPITFRKYFYYGGSIVYLQRFPIPLPFTGGQHPLGTYWNFQWTFPYRVAVQYCKNKFSFQTGLRPSGQWFILHEPIRDFHLYANFMGFIRIQGKPGKDIMIFSESAFMIQQFNTIVTDYKQLQHGVYFMVGLSLLGGKTFLQQLSEILSL